MKRALEGGLVGLAAIAAVGCDRTDNLTNTQTAASALSSGRSNITEKGGGSSASTPSIASYGGGPIIEPEIVSIYWGNFTQTQITNNQTYLQGLGGYISGTGAPQSQEPTIWQYGVHSARVGTYMTDTTLPNHNNTSGHAIDSDVRAEITKLQQQNSIGYSSQRVFVVFTSGITFDAGSGNYPTGVGGGYCGDPNVSGGCFCAYHQAVANNQWYGLVPMPYQPSGGSNNCLSAGSPLDSTGVLQVMASHEISEAATDPLPFTGWTNEIGDDCSWGSNMIQMSFGYVQNVADNMQSKCSTYTKEQPPQVSVASWGSGRLDVIALGAADHGAYHQAWNGSSWLPSITTYEPHGGTFQTAPVAISWGANRLDIFGEGTDGDYYHQAWNGSGWDPSITGWEGHGGTFTGPPALASWAAGRLDIFGRGTDGALYHQAWNGTGWDPSISTWEYHGGTLIGPPSAVSWGANRVDVFVEGPDGGYYRQYWDGGPNWKPGPTITDWENVGHPTGITFIGPPQVVSWGANRIDLFGLGTDGHYYHKAWTGSTPSGWEDHGNSGNGAFIGPPILTSWASGRLDILGMGSDGHAYHQAWNGSAWLPSITTYENHSGTFASAPAARSWGPNRYDFFGPSSGNGQLYHQGWDGTQWVPTPGMTNYEPHGGSIQ